MKTALFRLLAAVCMLSYGFIAQAQDITYTYSDIAVPGATSTSPRGINSTGDVAGYYESSG